MSNTELQEEKKKLLDSYNKFKEQKLKLDMSRGKPGDEQLDISVKMLDIINSKSECKTRNGIECRNYGLSDGIPEIKELFGKLMQVPSDWVIVGGNSSLNMMFDTFTCLMTHGISGCDPWIKQGKIKFLCPSPGYDRHFAILDYYNVEPIVIKMNDDGPDMDEIERYILNDESVKGIWCVPKYSNPTGITYSDAIVKRFSKLKPKAKDFRIFWDDAYAIHDVSDTPDKLLSLMNEAIKNGNEDKVIVFCSTSKITFPGSGVAAMAASPENLNVFKKRYSIQTIGYDKINQLRHMHFFNNFDGMLEHMKKHKEILKPKFGMVINKLKINFEHSNLVDWSNPNGGYFVSVNVMQGCAKRTVELCKNAGLILTSAGATFPGGKDPKDRNIRIAPTYPTVRELEKAMDLFCMAVKIALIERIQKERK